MNFQRFSFTDYHKDIMRRVLFCIVLSAWPQLTAQAQGVFLFYNPGAPTYLGTLGGPLAGPGIWGQALVGLTSDSLAPLGPGLEHRVGGLLPGWDISVPYANFYTYVQVQLAAWDGSVWGTNFAGVPANQIGFTDVVPVQVVIPTDGIWYSPRFNESAVVPPVPEPSPVAIAVAGSVACGLVFRERQRHKH